MINRNNCITTIAGGINSNKTADIIKTMIDNLLLNKTDKALYLCSGEFFKTHLTTIAKYMSELNGIALEYLNTDALSIFLRNSNIIQDFINDNNIQICMDSIITKYHKNNLSKFIYYINKKITKYNVHHLYIDDINTCFYDLYSFKILYKVLRSLAIDNNVSITLTYALNNYTDYSRPLEELLKDESYPHSFIYSLSDKLILNKQINTIIIK